MELWVCTVICVGVVVTCWTWDAFARVNRYTFPHLGAIPAALGLACLVVLVHREPDQAEVSKAAARTVVEITGETPAETLKRRLESTDGM